MLVLGSGNQVRCFTWIGDVADAIAAWSFAPETRNDDFNLGNPEPITMLALAEQIYALFHELSGADSHEPLAFKHAPAPADDVQVRIPDISKARERLGWFPQVSLDEMLRRCLEATLERSSIAAG
jgi:nucleoside-diphosphate-sugar epimerase